MIFIFTMAMLDVIRSYNNRPLKAYIQLMNFHLCWRSYTYAVCIWNENWKTYHLLDYNFSFE